MSKEFDCLHRYPLISIHYAIFRAFSKANNHRELYCIPIEFVKVSNRDSMDHFHRSVRVDPSRLFASIRAKRSVVREDSNDDLFSVEYHRDIPKFPKKTTDEFSV